MFGVIATNERLYLQDGCDATKVDSGCDDAGASMQTQIHMDVRRKRSFRSQD